MANAQILIVARSAAEVRPEVFRAAVEEAVRGYGFGLSRWTYDATPVSTTSDGHVETVQGGTWDGVSFSNGAAPGDARAVLSAFRQNVVGIPISSAQADAALAAISASVRASLTRAGVQAASIRSAFRTTRNPISFDRGVPAPIDLSEGGPGGGMGLLAVLGIAGVIAYTYRGA